MVRYEVQKRMARMAMAYVGVHQMDGIPVTISVASAMPPRSAPMLMTLATVRSKQAPHNTQRGYRFLTTAARPRPVTIPSRAHINCTAAIMGKEKIAVHRGPYPND